ncbi:MAG: hypothetical protein KU29_05565 [Sulfurovum sp. FS06-10]|nr:MAG: hypothetical protein KU29_05565 [Sulfurovum sp. FS06-10]
MKKILLLLTLLVSFVSADELKLKSGWNLVGVNANLMLDEIKKKIGNECQVSPRCTIPFKAIA